MQTGKVDKNIRDKQTRDKTVIKAVHDKKAMVDRQTETEVGDRDTEVERHIEYKD